jgi:glycosyltransferase involved in cell wall biosynthesis
MKSGGVFQYSQTILDAFISLPEDRYEKHVVFFDKDWFEQFSCSSKIKAEFANGDHHYYSCEKNYNSWKICLGRFFYRILNMGVRENDNFDLCIFPAQDSLAYQLPYKSLVSIHDLMHRYERIFPEVGNYQTYNAREIHYMRICKYSEGIMVDSEIGKTQLMESYPNVNRNRVFVLPYIHRKSLFDKVDYLSVKNKYLLPDKFIFYPAQFWKHKNHQGLIDAIAIVKKSDPDIKLILTGEKNNGYTDVLESIERNRLGETVRYIGCISDLEMNALYYLARAMVMPSFFGPTNIPPLEAMATGCPCAVSNVYAMATQIGGAGLLFDPNSAMDIAEKIRLLWNDDSLCLKMAVIGLRRTKEIYSQLVFNANFENIVEECMK